MKTRKPYVSPRLIKVKLNHTQAVLSQCSVTALTLRRSVPDECSGSPHFCRQDQAGHGGDFGSSS